MMVEGYDFQSRSNWREWSQWWDNKTTEFRLRKLPQEYDFRTVIATIHRIAFTVYPRYLRIQAIREFNRNIKPIYDEIENDVHNL